MSPETVGLIGICVLLVLMFLKMPIGFCMAFIGGLGMLLLKGYSPMISLFGTEPFSHASDYILSVIPLFVFMGFLAAYTPMGSEAFYTLNKWIGHLPGGLAMGTVGACTIFAAICGDPISTAATITSVSLREMRKYNYKDHFSLASIASGGNLGFLIPPSLIFIVYAIMTEQSVGTLFISGILPGLMLSAMFMVTIYIVAKWNPQVAPPAPAVSWSERLSSTPRVFWVLVVIILVLGGIYGGVFTPTEAGAVGSLVMLIIALIRKQLPWKNFKLTLSDTAMMVGRVFILIIGAFIFNRFLVSTDFPQAVASFVAGFVMPRYATLAIVLIVYLIIGCIMDIAAIILVLVPILHPLLVQLGFDPVWLAVLTTITVLIGQVTPPVGIVVFALSGMTDVPSFTIYRGCLPFIYAMLIGLVILIIFPEISLFLPYTMRPA